MQDAGVAFCTQETRKHGVLWQGKMEKSFVVKEKLLKTDLRVEKQKNKKVVTHISK